MLFEKFVTKNIDQKKLIKLFLPDFFSRSIELMKDYVVYTQNIFPLHRKNSVCSFLRNLQIRVCYVAIDYAKNPLDIPNLPTQLYFQKID